MVSILKRILVPVVFSGLLGCVTQGRNFESNTDWIKPSQTRQTDVKLMLKEPYAVGNSSGVQTWTYGYYKYRVFGKSQTKELKFYWKPDHTVDHYSYNSSFPTGPEEE
jgi:hypothetical protein